MDDNHNKPSSVWKGWTAPYSQPSASQPPKVEEQGRKPLDMADFNMMNCIGHWMQQTGVVGEDVDGNPIHDSVLDKANRIKANKVFGELLDRFSNEIKNREGNDAAL